MAAVLLAPVVLALASPAQASDSLLPPLPAGWRGERLEFPLSFAPELEYRGHEDLAFAPGMFVPDSESYFSYALALRLEGEVELDEPLLARFLETYYRGLCRAVAAERKLARDAGTVRAKVRRVDEGYRATVELFDPFTTGEDLELVLELRQHDGPRATEVLGLASPMPAGAPIWEELHALGQAWRAARPAPLYLNHVFAVVDRETYAALCDSRFLREVFAPSEERATVRADRSYSGLYFYGRRTYVEFLPAETAAGLSEGASGLALGVEEGGGLAGFARRLAVDSLRSQGGPITRELDGKALPWFDILGVELPPSPLSLFAMEYDPRFLAAWHAERAPRLAGIARAAVLERYAAVLGRSEAYASAPFADVRAVELALDEAQRERLLAVCAAAGHELEADSGGWKVFGPQFRLVLRAVAEPGGVTGLELALRRPLEHEPLELGKVRVSFLGERARIDLGP